MGWVPVFFPVAQPDLEALCTYTKTKKKEAMLVSVYLINQSLFTSLCLKLKAKVKLSNES